MCVSRHYYAIMQTQHSQLLVLGRLGGLCMTQACSKRTDRSAQAHPELSLIPLFALSQLSSVLVSVA